MQIHEILHSTISTRLIGSINGLLCLYPFVLSNPATREARQLPLPREQYDPCRSTTGFGYSPIVNDYKIGVKLDLYCFNNVSANGSIFWHRRNSDAIVSYDIATEVFTLIPFSTPLSTILNVYDDKLALVSIKNKWIELWVLEKGNDSSSETWSWIKKHTERYLSDYLLWWTIWRNHLTVYDYYPPIHDFALYLFKIPTNEMKVGSIPEVDGDRPHYVFNYAESLVPLRQHTH
ncbi:hypothetical protein K1719_002047 [Acacia pycnantha]|nr:hypothetical protein K1719_002047 [Acacia pycnantha]